MSHSVAPFFIIDSNILIIVDLAEELNGLALQNTIKNTTLTVSRAKFMVLIFSSLFLNCSLSAWNISCRVRLWKYDPPAPGFTYLFHAKGGIKLAGKVNYESTSFFFLWWQTQCFIWEESYKASRRTVSYIRFITMEKRYIERCIFSISEVDKKSSLPVWRGRKLTVMSCLKWPAPLKEWHLKMTYTLVSGSTFR